MNQDTQGRPLDEDLVALTEGYANGTLGPGEGERLERILLEDTEARAFFRRYLGLDATLHEHGAGLPSELPALLERALEADVPGTSRRRRWSIGSKRLWGAAAAVVLLAVIGLAVVMVRDGKSDRAAVAAAVDKAEGDVRILSSNGQVRGIESGMLFNVGDTVRTLGGHSSVLLAYPDGTRLTLFGDASLTCGDHRSKNLILHQGVLAASVTPQPAERPMVLATPSAQVQVVGTRFVLEALARRTDLSVTKGMVRLVRAKDGNSVEVGDGKRASLSEQGKLVVEDIPRVLPGWQVDFEDGVPEGWENFERVTGGLPAGSRGGVRPMREVTDEGIVQYVVRTDIAWARGLFAAQKGSHLHVTFKTESVDWINVLITTRTAGAEDPRFAGNYILADFPKAGGGHWQTATIPLALFKRIHSGDLAIESVLPYRVAFVSHETDRGLVIDRIWVTPDGPGEIEVRAVR